MKPWTIIEVEFAGHGCYQEVKEATGIRMADPCGEANQRLAFVIAGVRKVRKQKWALTIGGLLRLWALVTFDSFDALRRGTL